MYTHTVAYQCRHSPKILKIIVAKIMIGREGFTQWSGIAQVKTRSLYEAKMKIMIDCVGLNKGKTRERR